MDILANTTEVATTAVNTFTLQDMTVGIVITLIIGLLVCFTYMKTTKKTEISESFILTLIIIPIVINIIIALIGNNVASAFSLAGAFSIVRFRSEPGDPKDIGYIFFSMAGGLACGMGLYTYAILFTLILCLIMFVLNKLKFGVVSSNKKQLKVLIPENYDYEGAFDDLFNAYTNDHTLIKVKTVDLGSLYELSYIINLKDGARQKDFLDNIRCRNGNLTVLLSIA